MTTTAGYVSIAALNPFKTNTIEHSLTGWNETGLLLVGFLQLDI
jgi:hypothetical protein